MNDCQITFTARERAESIPVSREAKPLAADEIRGSTLATLISAGTELALYTRDEADAFPLNPGYAAVFAVEEVGAAVTQFQPGDRAFCMGPHRSFQHLPARDALPIPPGLPSADATLARLMSVSMTTLSTTAARPGDAVLVTGLGPVGHLASKLFAACGYRVVACDPVAARREMLRGVSGITVRNEVPHGDPEFAARVALVLECSGHEQAALDGCGIVRKGGEVVLVGVPWRRRTEIYAHEILNAVFHRYVVLRSGWEWELPRYSADFQPASIQNNLALALQWLAEGRIDVRELYSVAHITEAQKAYQALLNGESSALATAFLWAS